ncbi:MAG: hypothetical protein RR595_09630 [Lysinibacillus sp.]
MLVTTYKIEKNLAAKKVNICVGDQITLAEAEKFDKEFGSTLSSIDASSFELHIDSTNMKVLTPDLAVKLGGAMGLYKQAGFKKIVIELSQSTVLKMQVSRLVREAGLTNTEVVTK